MAAIPGLGKVIPDLSRVKGLDAILKSANIAQEIIRNPSLS